MSRTNIYRMRAFYLAHPAEIVPQPVGRLSTEKTRPAIVPQPVGQIPETVADLPWAHHALLIERVPDAGARRFYAAAAMR
ncbi:MAG: PDDEXK nuclease domain-containing protein, partial [Polyangiales bacterium]